VNCLIIHRYSNIVLTNVHDSSSERVYGQLIFLRGAARDATHRWSEERGKLAVPPWRRIDPFHCSRTLFERQYNTVASSELCDSCRPPAKNHIVEQAYGACKAEDAHQQYSKRSYHLGFELKFLHRVLALEQN